MADVPRNRDNSWFQKLNHIRLPKSEVTKPLVLDAAVSRATAAGKTIASLSGPTGPTNTVAPVNSGNPQVGDTLSSTTGTWTGEGTITYAYQWLDDDVEILGATSNTFTLTAAQEGGNITCRVTATDDNGSTAATSNSLGPVAAASGFDPASLFTSGEVGLIWDPSDASTVFQDAGTTAAGDGDPLGQINDLSPNAKNGTQTVTADKPQLIQDAGGKWGIVFDGAGDHLNFSTVEGIKTFGVAYKLGSGETSGVMIYQGSGDYLGVFQDGNTGAVSSDWGTDTIRVDGAALGTINRDTLHDAMAAGTDGKTVILSEHNGGVPSGTSGLGNYGGSFVLSGTVYAMVVIDRLLTTSERDNLEAWLAEKSGVTL